MDFQGMLSSIIGSAAPGAVADATRQHIGAMSAPEVSQHLQEAAANANESGNPDVAREFTDLADRAQSDPTALKAAAISYISSNPQILTHFAPAFAQGILSKL